MKTADIAITKKKLITEMSVEEKLTIAESKVAYLEMENDFLKKLEIFYVLI